MQPGDEALWSRAVERILAPEDRDGRLASIAELAETLADSRCYLYAALDDDEPAGLLSAYRFPDAAGGGQLVYLYDIEVLADHRRHGAGSALVNALVDACEAERVRLIWAGTANDNTAAQRTFEATDGERTAETYVEYEWDLEEDE